jgi:hypothetical protein
MMLTACKNYDFLSLPQNVRILDSDSSFWAGAPGLRVSRKEKYGVLEGRQEEIRMARWLLTYLLY